MSELEQRIIALINGLNMIEVKGETNLILLANSITMLKKIQADLAEGKDSVE